MSNLHRLCPWLSQVQLDLGLKATKHLQDSREARALERGQVAGVRSHGAWEAVGGI